MEIADYLFSNPENLEFPMDEEELMELLRDYLEEIDNLLAADGDTMSGVNDYDSVCRLWMENLQTYAKEAFDNLLIGNLYSMSIILRTIVENKIYFLYIRKFREEELWKNWLVFSHLKMLRSIGKASDSECRLLFQRVLEEYELKEKEFSDYLKNEKEVYDYQWLRPVFQGKRLNFRELCRHLGQEETYEDYRQLCNYTHGQNLYMKIGTFTFYNTIIHKIVILVECMMHCAEEYFGNEWTAQLDEIRIQMYELLCEEGWVV